MLLVAGQKIRDARLSAGLTQAQLARAIETTERNVIRWENGQNQPRVASLSAIAQATGHDIDFFLTASGEADEEEEAALSGLTREEAAVLDRLSFEQVVSYKATRAAVRARKERA